MTAWHSRTGLYLFLLLPTLSTAADWMGSTEHGGVIRIDPDTNKATIYSDQGSSQLWDGVHRLDNGSVVIVREGVVISGGGQGSDSSEAATVKSDHSPAPTDATCANLVIRVCGFNGECANSPGCSPARQLFKLEGDEARRIGRAEVNQTTLQCREAMSNEHFFSPCRKPKASNASTACEDLVKQVCGPANECVANPICFSAKQMLDMETEERMASRHPEEATYSTGRCAKALTDTEEFKACPSN